VGRIALRHLVTVVLAATLATPLFASAARADTPTTAVLVQSTWFWREQATNVGGSGLSPPSPLSDPSVPSGDLAVAGPEANNQPDKETYLEFALDSIPPGSTITSFKVRLPVDPNATSVAPTATAPPIIVCAPKGNWSGGPGAEPFSAKPDEACATNAPKVTSSDGGRTYVAEIAPIAQQWIEPGALNNGMAITNDPHNVSTAYQVVFGPSSALQGLSAAVTYLAPGNQTAPVATPAQSSAPTPPADGAPVEIAPAPGPSSPAVASSPEPAPNVLTTTVPAGDGAAAPLAAAPVPARPSAALASPGSIPPVGFWIIAVLLSMLLALVAATLDAPPPPVATGRGQVARTLARRRALGSTPHQP